MPSIRRSLMAYFLLLTGVAVGAVGVCVHLAIAQALAAREAAETKRIHQETDAKCQEGTAHFDKELSADARTLSRDFGRAYFQAYERIRPPELFLAPAGGPDRWAAALLPVATPYPAVAHAAVEAAQSADAARRAADAGDHAGGDHGEAAYFQVHLPAPARAPALVVLAPKQPFAFPFDREAIDRQLAGREDPALHDDVDVPGHGTFRRVVLTNRSRRGPPPGNPRPPGPPGPPPTAGGGGTPTYIQFARPKADLDAALARHLAARDADLAGLATQTRDALKRTWLLLTAAAAALFVALPVGSWLIVGRGLRPLDTLTQAVSRVSERDFRLPVAAADLSPDLAPIHARLTATLDALRRAFDREKQAVADISHELRTPLAALQTTLDVALRKPRDAERYQATLADCRDITKQLSRLVDRILTLASLDAGDAPSRLPVNVGDLAAECAAVIRPLAEGHNLTFAADLDPRATSTTDPDKLREVMMNLLHNAVEYNRPGGQVRLSVTQAADGVRIAVADTGIGMTADVSAKIFERFYRADPSRHATGVHAGLGLAIVKEYVDRLNGRLTVTTRPGEGTRFEVALPAVTA